MQDITLPQDSEKKSYRVMLQSGVSSLVAEIESDGPRATAYQSEAELEEAFIAQLEKQAYQRLRIASEADLIANLRTQLEKLNNIEFSDKEWERFFKTSIANDKDGIVEKTRRIQEDYIQVLIRDNGSSKNIKLIDKDNIHNNSLQVINQYETDEGTYKNRYDVTILVNGLPLVHIELKRRGVAIKEAFNQINRYQRQSFWAGSGLYEYVQIFVISNGTHTKYYSNTTRDAHIKEAYGKRGRKKTSHSFEFTMWWASIDNKPIMDLVPFTKTFFAKHTLLNILTKYCVFNEQNILMVMRPYQIAATEKILNRVLISENNKKMLGTLAAGGYVWHTTGSGKTLTSFKASQIASEMSTVDKVLFVVDRKDLDYQTKKEYDKFEKDSVSASASTRELVKNLNDDNKPIAITTIQKLASFIKKTEKHPIYDKHIVFIFDECHRSQFGEMHKAITKKFSKYHLFGFTGTPIFSENASSSNAVDLRTTKQAFGEELHSYNIINAIEDGNVLPFRIDYVNTIKSKEGLKDEQVYSIATEEALLDQDRIDEIVAYVLEHFDKKTMRTTAHNGFNSLFAAASIEAAKRYYATFKKQIAVQKRNLKIAVIYSFAANEESPDFTGIPEEGFEPDALDTPSREFLDDAIKDYNVLFNTNYSTKDKEFENYYQDVSNRMKSGELDMLIVVGMFLTGFDAPTLNTLWVDKNFKMHGLIQAFSRTNRIYNSVKAYGNIVCFRNLEKNVEEAIACFGNKDAHGIVLLRPYHEYLSEYIEKLTVLQSEYPLGEKISSPKAQIEFVKLFGSILRLRNILVSFDDFEADDVLTARDLQDYSGTYQDIYDAIGVGRKAEAKNINEDLVFEIELIKQVEINIDYILLMVEKYRSKHGKNKEIVADIERAIKSSPTLRNKKELILQFIESVTATSNVAEDWTKYITKKREADLMAIIQEERLDEERTRSLVELGLQTGSIQDSGTEIAAILPRVSLFSKSGERTNIRVRVVEKLKAFVEKYFGV